MGNYFAAGVTGYQLKVLEGTGFDIFFMNKANGEELEDLNVYFPVKKALYWMSNPCSIPQICPTIL